MFTVVIKDKLLKYNPALDLYSIVDLFSEKTKKPKYALKKPGIMVWLKKTETDKKAENDKFTIKAL
jgi:hypothetical protein